jgi:superfamily I DNA/RNA helicase
VKMIPDQPRAGANASEKKIFSALEGIMDRPDWTVIHSLSLTDNLFTLEGEVDFVVFVPGRGILVIEAKSPNYAEYKGGDWYLDKVPKPSKSPLDQLNKAKTSIFRFLENRDLFNNVPIARLLWFTSLGRHQFDNKSPGDMQFFEWELALQEDLAKPAQIIEKVLDEYIKHNEDREQVTLAPASFDKAAATAAAGALVNDFKIYRTAEDRRLERSATSSKLLAEQVALLDLVETNEHLFFDGAAGTGKTFLLIDAAIKSARAGRPSLVVCWNVMMAEELKRLMGPRDNMEVYDFNTLMLAICGLQSNPKNASSDWYDDKLPAKALEVLKDKPHWGDYEAIFIDEFQDVVGNTKILELLFELSASKKPKGTRLVLASDKNQQILSDKGKQSNPFELAKMLVPDLVHVRLRTNCRTAPSLAKKVPELTGLTIDIIKHRLPASTDGGLEILIAKEGKESRALAETLRELLKEYRAKDIRVLSPFGIQSSLAGELFTREAKSADERWLKNTLRHPNASAGEIPWRSISKFKGLESEVVVITDINEKSAQFALDTGKSLSEYLYVGITRAKYRCVLISSEQYGAAFGQSDTTQPAAAKKIK